MNNDLQRNHLEFITTEKDVHKQLSESLKNMLAVKNNQYRAGMLCYGKRHKPEQRII